MAGTGQIGELRLRGLEQCADAIPAADGDNAGGGPGRADWRHRRLGRGTDGAARFADGDVMLSRRFEENG